MAGTGDPDETLHMPESHGRCPSCKQGDLITIEMAVSERDLTFTTCHLCEAKWWQRDGELVPLASIIDLVVKR
jgi:DNA polymerase III alpha subunit (gram-positive type)